MRTLVLLLLGAVLAGCNMQTFKSSVAGSCAVFERPPYAVRGATSYDQDVADNFVESGVAGCNWKRPAARPASLDAPRGKVSVPAKRKSLIRRIKERVLPPRSAPPEIVTPAPDPVPTPPPAKPRSAADELLGIDR